MKNMWWKTCDEKWILFFSFILESKDFGGKKVKVKAAQLCSTLCNPMDCVVHGILQARILEWVAFPFLRGSSQPRDQTQVSHIVARFFTSWATSTNSVPRPLRFLASRWLSLSLSFFFFFYSSQDAVQCTELRGWVARIIKMIEVMELEFLRPFPPQLCKLEWRDKMNVVSGSSLSS